MSVYGLLFERNRNISSSVKKNLMLYINFNAKMKLGKLSGNDTHGSDTHRAVVLLLQQGWDVSSEGHLLGQLLILQANPPPQLLQEAQ